MPTVIDSPDLVPLCPHCDAELREVLGTETSSSGQWRFSWGKRTVYACPHCRRALGVSHRKGFWAG
jgi:uncharacterized protein with PIN domain